jgi:hypothetical protein
VVASPGDTSADVVMNVTMPPFDNIHVRCAIAYAIDRPAEVAESADPSTPDTANSILTPGELGTFAPKAQVTALLDSLPNYPYNLAKAKAELAQSPYRTVHHHRPDRPVRHLHPRNRSRRRPARKDRDHRQPQGDVARGLGRQIRRPEEHRILGHHQRGGR